MELIEVDAKFKKWARMGYFARGVIYLVIGGLALMTAFGEGGGTTDSKGAIMTILNQPFGYLMLGLLIIGLFGYTSWRLVQAIKDVDHHGTSMKGLGVRAGLLISAITHALLGIWAIGLLIGFGSSSGGGQGDQQGWINSDLGQVALGVAAIAVLIAGAAHIYKGWTAGFEKYMAIPPDKNGWARPVCRFGLIARGVVWGIIGWFLIQSAMLARSGEVHGVADALASLRDNAYGPWLLGVVAAGLFAFGMYSVLEAFYRRIQPSS